jgi:hypothetical protein
MTIIHSKLFYGDRVKLSAAREEDVDIMMRWGEDAEYL